MFFNAALTAPNPIAKMPGVSQFPVSHARAQAKLLAERGIKSVILFGLPKTKDPRGDSGCDPDGPVPRAVAEMKSAVPELVVITDVCVDEYTDHGHCGILRTRRDGSVEVDNDATLEVLAKMAIMHAKAGADIIAPSDMMDGRVARIRKALDAESFETIAILSYAVKYASCFYGPFRDAVNVTIACGDRAGYQMDPANAREALREAALDEAEGADILMVKPGLPYLDLLRELSRQIRTPWAVYHVSGEFAALEALAAQGLADRAALHREVMTAFRRAGASMIITYGARYARDWLAA